MIGPYGHSPSLVRPIEEMGYSDSSFSYSTCRKRYCTNWYWQQSRMPCKDGSHLNLPPESSDRFILCPDASVLLVNLSRYPFHLSVSIQNSPAITIPCHHSNSDAQNVYFNSTKRAQWPTITIPCHHPNSDAQNVYFNSMKRPQQNPLLR